MPIETPRPAGAGRPRDSALDTAILDAVVRLGTLVMGVATAMRSRPELRAAITEAVDADFRRRFAVIEQRAAERGEIHDGADVELLVEVVRLAMFGRMLVGPDGPGPEYVQRLVDHLMVPVLGST